MPIDDRDFVRGKHPPACTCKECTDRRLGKFRSQAPQKRGADTQKTRSTIRRGITPPRFLQRIWLKIPPSVIKLFLSLLVIAGLADMIRRGYLLFTQRTDPIKNTIIFLVEVGLWFWIVAILRSRRYRYRNPKFKLTFIVVLAVILVCTFAGIEPLSSYKDNLFTSIGNYLEEQRLEREAATKAAEEARVKAEEAAQAEAAKKAVEQAKAEEERLTQEVLETERLAFELINKERMLNGIMPTQWDDELYRLSKAHTQAMSDKGELFHSPMDSPIGENAWGGAGYYRYGTNELANVIVDSWMSSPLHRAWILHAPLQKSVVSIVVTPTGQYASWTFRMSEAGEGPELVKQIAEEWRRETGESIPWIEWLKMKGYLH